MIFFFPPDKIWIGLGFAPKSFTIVKRCDEQYTGNPKLGDLFVVKCGSSSGGPAPGYHHAGVCCNEEEKKIIQLTCKPLHICIMFWLSK